MRADYKPPPQFRPPRPLGEGIGVRVMTMTKKQINACDRAAQAHDKLYYRKSLSNQSNASIRRTTGTQAPDPILPVPTMLKPYNRNPLTIHIASHTGSEVRGEGKLQFPLSGVRNPFLTLFNAPSVRRRRVIPDPLFVIPALEPEPSRSGRASAANYYLGTPSRVRRRRTSDGFV